MPMGPPANETDTENPLNLNRALRTGEVTIQLQGNSQKDTALRNVKPTSGSGTVPFSNGEFTLTTTASGADAAALETAVAEYPAGLEATMSAYIEKDSDPVGFMEVGYGGDDFDDELRWHWNSNGVPRFDRVRGGTRATITRDQWDPSTVQEDVEDTGSNVVGEVTGFDKMDGEGPSGFDVSPPIVGLVGVDMVLYGGGGFAPWFVDLSGDRMIKEYAFVFTPKNESIVQQFNQPVFGRLDNDGTATADTAVMTERQFSFYGRNAAPKRATPHVVNETGLSISSPTPITAFRRADPGGPTRLDFLKLFIRVDNRAHLYFLYDPVTVANDGDSNWVNPSRDDAGNQVSSDETAIEANDDLQVDPATGVAIAGPQFEGGSGQNIDVGSTSLADTSFQRDKPIAVMVEPFGGNDITDVEAIFQIEEGL